MKPLDANLLRANQIEDLEQEKEALQVSVGGGRGPEGSLPGYRNAGSAEVRSRLRGVEKMLRDQKPEPLTGAEKDTLAKVEKELREKITHGMLSAETMRKCPATAVDEHIRWERTNKKDIMKWKNVRLQLDGCSGDRDVANLEQFRPASSGHRIMTDGVIPGLHTMSEQAKDNWPLGEPTCDTAVKQTERVRKKLSDDARAAATERLRKAREIKKVKEQELRVPPVVMKTQIVGFKPEKE